MSENASLTSWNGPPSGLVRVLTGPWPVERVPRVAVFFVRVVRCSGNSQGRHTRFFPAVSYWTTVRLVGLASFPSSNRGSDGFSIWFFVRPPRSTSLAWFCASPRTGFRSRVTWRGVTGYLLWHDAGTTEGGFNSCLDVRVFEDGNERP